MIHRVPISDCRPQFRRAHKALIDSLGGSYHIARRSRSGNGYWQVLEYNWKKQYNITPRNAVDSTEWKYLDFDSEAQYTLFLLRWS